MATKSINFIYGLGRRKEATARVRLHKGKGENLVNGKLAKDVFSGQIMETVLFRPLAVVDVLGKYYFTAKVTGGGSMSQVDAVALGISRALAKDNPEQFKPKLRKHGLLTRDPREREPRKVGMGGKARRKKQSPKR